MLRWSDGGGQLREEDLQAHDLRGYGFDPGHEERVLARFAVDNCTGNIADPEIGLVEHVAIESVRGVVVMDGKLTNPSAGRKGCVRLYRVRWRSGR